MTSIDRAIFIGLEHIQLLPAGDPKTGSLSGNIEKSVENRIFVNKSVIVLWMKEKEGML